MPGRAGKRRKSTQNPPLDEIISPCEVRDRAVVERPSSATRAEHAPISLEEKARNNRSIALGRIAGWVLGLPSDPTSFIPDGVKPEEPEDIATDYDVPPGSPGRVQLGRGKRRREVNQCSHRDADVALDATIYSQTGRHSHKVEEMDTSMDFENVVDEQNDGNTDSVDSDRDHGLDHDDALSSTSRESGLSCYLTPSIVSSDESAAEIIPSACAFLQATLFTLGSQVKRKRALASENADDEEDKDHGDAEQDMLRQIDHYAEKFSVAYRVRRLESRHKRQLAKKKLDLAHQRKLARLDMQERVAVRAHEEKMQQLRHELQLERERALAVQTEKVRNMERENQERHARFITQQRTPPPMSQSGTGPSHVHRTFSMHGGATGPPQHHISAPSHTFPIATHSQRQSYPRVVPNPAAVMPGPSMYPQGHSLSNQQVRYALPQQAHNPMQMHMGYNTSL